MATITGGARMLSAWVINWARRAMVRAALATNKRFFRFCKIVNGREAGWIW